MLDFDQHETHDRGLLMVAPIYLRNISKFKQGRWNIT